MIRAHWTEWFNSVGNADRCKVGPGTASGPSVGRVSRSSRILALLLVGILPSVVMAGEPAARVDDTLVRAVTDAVIDALGENPELLDQAVDRGIQRHIDRQRAKQEQAKAEQVRLAQEKAKQVRRPQPERDHIRGNPDAALSLIEYSDFECPYCKRFHDTPKRLLDTYGDRLNWVYRHYPLAFHNPVAQKQAEATECARELGGVEAFWRYTDALYDRTTSGGKGFPIPKLVPLAEELGLDRAAFADCLEGGRHAAKVQEDLDEGTAIGITGTPGSILLNNETGEVRVFSGALPESAFVAGIEELTASEGEGGVGEENP